MTKIVPACARPLALLAGMMLVSPAPAIAGDFETGQRAYQAGDYERALKEWRPLAAAGDARAQYRLGLMHEYGRGVPRSDEAAATWFTEAAARDNPDAQYRLGVLYENGWGPSRDTTVAARLYELAAEQGHAFAQHDLAFMLIEGDGLPRDRIEAYKWLKLASLSRGALMTKHLELLARDLSRVEILEAEARAQAWLAARD